MGTTQSDWIEQTVDTGTETLPVLTRHLAGRLVGVPGRPLLARGPNGRPKVALTLGLSRKPSVDTASLEPLVTYGLLGFTTTLALPENSNALAGAGETLVPLFARSAVFKLEQAQTDSESQDLQEVRALGSEASAGFSLALGREAALQALAALRGASSRLTVSCALEVQSDTQARRLQLSGSYGALYEALARYGSQLDRPTIEAAIADALDSAALSVESQPPDPSLAQIVDAFLKICGPILRPQGTLFGVRRPWSDSTFDVSVQVTPTPSTDTLTLSCPLDTLLAGALKEQDSDAILRLIVPDEQGLPAPLPRRVQQIATRTLQQPTTAGAGRLAKLGLNATTLSVVARPQVVSKLDAHLQLQELGARPATILANGGFWLGNDLSVVLPTKIQPLRSLPRVEDAAAALWPDHQSPDQYWYAPEYTIDPAAPSGDPSSGPFLFVFHASGHTASGAAGLNGAVRIRIRPNMSAATQAAWQAANQPKLLAVPPIGLSVVLNIPFRDQSGATRGQAFAATLLAEGDAHVAEIALLDDWLRLAYGALSTPGFQSAPATLSVAYTFQAYVRTNATEVSFVLDHKLATLQLEAAAPVGPKAGPYLDTSALTYNTSAVQLKFGREQALSARDLATFVKARPNLESVSGFAIRPELLDPVVAPGIVAERFGVQSIGRALTQNLLYPCDSLGAFYLQELPDGTREAIGCRDAFKLGQTEYRQYQRITELNDPDYSVWRSLQQPGRFLLVPQRWAIARFAADDPERAYRPAIIVYSTLDAQVPENNRGALLASLLPDISTAKRRALAVALSTLAQNPILSLINEIEVEMQYAWPLPASSGIEQRTVKLFDSFQVTLVCALDGIPQLQAMLQGSGLVGSVQYSLPDGTSMSAALSLDLNHIVGPAPDGPVVARLLPDTSECELSNRIERAVDISDLVIESDGGGPVQHVRVDQRLESGASLKVSVPPGAAHATPVASLVAGSGVELTEIRSFVEDVHTNVAFINLINFANHAIAGLTVQARIRDLPDISTLALDESARIGALEFVLPLTRYLANPEVQYAVTRTANDGTTSTGTWRNWPLASQGNVISLTWELIQ